MNVRKAPVALAPKGRAFASGCERPGGCVCQDSGGGAGNSSLCSPSAPFTRPFPPPPPQGARQTGGPFERRPPIPPSLTLPPLSVISCGLCNRLPPYFAASRLQPIWRPHSTCTLLVGYDSGRDRVFFLPARFCQLQPHPLFSPLAPWSVGMCASTLESARRPPSPITQFKRRVFECSQVRQHILDLETQLTRWIDSPRCPPAPRARRSSRPSPARAPPPPRSPAGPRKVGSNPHLSLLLGLRQLRQGAAPASSVLSQPT